MVFIVVLMLFLIVFLSVVGSINNMVNQGARVGKWLGLGAIFGNVLNNKINADASVKSGQTYQKKNLKTGNKIIDGTIDFISPEVQETDNIETHKTMSAEDFKEYQEFMKWKKMKESIDHKTDD